jgi:hypothetical protein
MYWTKVLFAEDFTATEDAYVLRHGVCRLTLQPREFDAYVVGPATTRAIAGYRAIGQGDGFGRSILIWLATFGRDSPGTVGLHSLQCLGRELEDEYSLAALLEHVAREAISCGAEALRISTQFAGERHLAKALERVAARRHQALIFDGNSGALVLPLIRG